MPHRELMMVVSAMINEEVVGGEGTDQKILLRV